jgi:hypothetical protein
VLGNFESLSNTSALTANTVVQSIGNKIEVCDYNGKPAFEIMLPENEGEVTLMDARTRFMAVVTSNNCIKMFDIMKTPYK